MTSLVTKTAAKKLLGKKLQEKFGPGDPYYERVPGVKWNGKPTGKQVKRKRALPTGLSEHDAKVLKGVRKRVHHLDWSLFTIFGIGFGWSSVIGLVPGIGDAVDGLMSLIVVRKCCNVDGGLPAAVKAQMMVNVALDFIVGLVPGAEALYRGNTRNALLLEDFLRQRAEKTLREIGEDPVPVVDSGSRRHHRGARRHETRSYRDAQHSEDGITVPDDLPGKQPVAKKRFGRRWH